MEPVDWSKEPGCVKVNLRNGKQFTMAMRYNGRILPTFEDGFLERITEIRDNFESKEGDILIYGYMKSGSHWIWEIIRMILGEDDNVSERDSKMQSFLESVSLAQLNSLPTPRVMSTHLAPSGLPASILGENTKVVVPVRHPKDTAVSMFHHLSSETKGTNLTCDWDTFIKEVWFDKDLAFYALWTEFTSEVWGRCRYKENYYPIIYEHLLEDPIEMIRDLAKFLGKGCLSEERLQKIATATKFENMKTKKIAAEKGLEKTFDNGYSMFRKGVSGDWKNHFTDEQNEMFDKKMKELCEGDPHLRQVMMFYDNPK